eukprot:2149043-Pyramimonas_sp.AAC.1
MAVDGEVLVDGRVLPSRHPWAQQMQLDIDFLACAESGDDLLLDADNRIDKLLFDPDTSEQFQRLDISELRAVFLRRAATSAAMQTEADTEEQLFYCREFLEDGS